MRTPFAVLLGLIALVSGACTRKPPDPDPTGAITGRENIGWDQSADNTAELATFRYAIYVDGVRTELANVTCGSIAATAGFPCSSPLPSMSPGTHSLELAAFTFDEGIAESVRSPALQVIIAAGPAATPAAVWRTEDLATADGVLLRAERIADGLAAPADAAFVPDGRLFIAERGGRVRIVDGARSQMSDALQLDDVSPPPQGGLLSIAVAPSFPRTHFVYLVYTVRESAATTFRLARFREAGGVLAERAILADGLPASAAEAAASLRFGPDGKLYLALDDGDDEERAARRASSAGKLLRMNDDGTTPRDQAGATPVLAAGLRHPRGLDWRASGLLWIADEDPTTGAGSLTALAAGASAPLRIEVRARRALDNFRPSALAFYNGRISGVTGDLFVASIEDRGILRIHFDPADPGRVVSTEPLLKDRVGGVRVVTAGPDGAIYFCTEDALGRLTGR